MKFIVTDNNQDNSNQKNSTSRKRALRLIWIFPLILFILLGIILWIIIGPKEDSSQITTSKDLELVVTLLKDEIAQKKIDIEELEIILNDQSNELEDFDQLQEELSFLQQEINDLEKIVENPNMNREDFLMQVERVKQISDNFQTIEGSVNQIVEEQFQSRINEQDYQIKELNSKINKLDKIIARLKEQNASQAKVIEEKDKEIKDLKLALVNNEINRDSLLQFYESQKVRFDSQLLAQIQEESELAMERDSLKSIVDKKANTIALISKKSFQLKYIRKLDRKNEREVTLNEDNRHLSRFIKTINASFLLNDNLLPDGENDIVDMEIWHEGINTGIYEVPIVNYKGNFEIPTNGRLERGTYEVKISIKGKPIEALSKKFRIS